MRRSRGFSTNTGKSPKVRKLTRETKESKRAPELKESLIKHGWTYIDYPVFEEWKVEKEDMDILYLRSCKTPTQFFAKFWNSNVWALFECKFQSRRMKWKKSKSAVIKNFFGLLLIKSVIGLISIKDRVVR